MDIDSARAVAIAAIKGSSALSSVLPLLKERCGPHEHEELRKLISRIAGDISLDISRKVFDAHPSLEHERDEAIGRDGLT